ncbi:hypothetical protein QWY29_20785, partial [Nocardioides sp. SOB72]|nr:hypothetical protein [Nocardioides abyssi]
DTDAKRFGRLFFQPLLVLWALYGGGHLRRRGRDCGRPPTLRPGLGPGAGRPAQRVGRTPARNRSTVPRTPAA